MHLKFPRRKCYYEWEELSCLSRALGFHHEVIKACLPTDLTNEEDGISHRELMKYIDLKFFNDALDRSANMHTADYNINVLRKSVELLNHRLLSFDELSDVRVASQVYEAGDMRGMVIDQHILMRALKLSGRTVAPLKLMHRVKHMDHRLDEPGRLQLYEFMDLLVLCELIDKVQVPESRHSPLDKTWRELFELDKFEDVFTTSDQKLEGLMDSLFIQEERSYGKERLGSTRIPKEVSIETSARKKLVRQQKQKYKELHESISQSNLELKRTRAGMVRPRPVTAPDTDEFRSRQPSELQRPHTVAETVDSMRVGDPRIQILLDLHRKRSSQTQPPCDPPSSTSAPQLRSPAEIGWTEARAQTPLFVTDKDVKERQHLLDSLQYEIETLDERSLKRLETRLGRSIRSRRRGRAPSGTGATPAVEIKKCEAMSEDTKQKGRRVSDQTRQRGNLCKIDGRRSQHHYKDRALEEKLNFIREQLSSHSQSPMPDQHTSTQYQGVSNKSMDNNFDFGSHDSEFRNDSQGFSAVLPNARLKDATNCSSQSSRIPVLGEETRAAEVGKMVSLKLRHLDKRKLVGVKPRLDPRGPMQDDGTADKVGDGSGSHSNVCGREKQSSFLGDGPLLRPSVVMRDQFEGSRVGTAATLYKYLREQVPGE